MIITKNLTKIYKIKKVQGKKTDENILAVDHINLEIKKGEIFGLIGPNGAGKTTLLKMLSTLIIPDEGTALVDGFDIVKDSKIIKNNINLIAGEFVRSLYWRLSGRQNLKFFANLRNIWDADERIDTLIDLFDLKKHEDELVMKYSTGMKHKLALAISLINDPEVVFLDEPLTGIDPVTAFEIKNIIKTKFSNKTIIWTSHNLYEIDEMCDRVALIKNGKIILLGAPDDLKKDYWGYDKIRIISDNPEGFKSIDKAKIIDNVIEIETKNVNETFFVVMELAKKNGIKIKEIKTLKPTLEEIFMKGMKNA